MPPSLGLAVLVARVRSSPAACRFLAEMDESGGVRGGHCSAAPGPESLKDKMKTFKEAMPATAMRGTSVNVREICASSQEIRSRWCGMSRQNSKVKHVRDRIINIVKFIKIKYNTLFHLQ